MNNFEIVKHAETIVTYNIRAKSLEDAERIASSRMDLIVSTIESMFPFVKFGTVYTAIGEMEE